MEAKSKETEYLKILYYLYYIGQVGRAQEFWQAGPNFTGT